MSYKSEEIEEVMDNLIFYITFNITGIFVLFFVVVPFLLVLV